MDEKRYERQAARERKRASNAQTRERNALMCKQQAEEEADEAPDARSANDSP